MSHRVHTSEDNVDSANREPMGDRVAPESELHHLPTRDNPTLSPSDPRQRPLTKPRFYVLRALNRGFAGHGAMVSPQGLRVVRGV